MSDKDYGPFCYKKTCPDCGGSGYFFISTSSGTASTEHGYKQICNRCDGKGYLELVDFCYENNDIDWHELINSAGG